MACDVKAHPYSPIDLASKFHQTMQNAWEERMVKVEHDSSEGTFGKAKYRKEKKLVQRYPREAYTLMAILKGDPMDLKNSGHTWYDEFGRMRVPDFSGEKPHDSLFSRERELGAFPDRVEAACALEKTGKPIDTW